MPEIRCSAERAEEDRDQRTRGKKGGMSDRRSFWPRIEIEEVSVCTDEQTMRGGWGSPNEGSEGTKCKRGRETVINMNGSEQMPIMDMNNQREGGAA